MTGIEHRLARKAQYWVQAISQYCSMYCSMAIWQYRTIAVSHYSSIALLGPSNDSETFIRLVIAKAESGSASRTLLAMSSRDMVTSIPGLASVNLTKVGNLEGHLAQCHVREMVNRIPGRDYI